MLAALIVAKIGPIVAEIIHTALEVIRLVALTTGVAVAVAFVTWAGIKTIRWQRRRHMALAASQVRMFTVPARGQTGPAAQAGCLACGGTGTVLRAIGAGRYQPAQCPVCEPARRAG